ncbi:alpha-amylase family glycosyl hydrolase [Mammaliicoccus sciuri]|uniref:alpha-glucosidase n=1 Tax=Mammaliicoccus sciuri TaxID=1296 RepID=UPI000EE50A62|nr:alpha-amylase family glycosyl hydrolase [Mammaliicoccus sciuri]MDO0952137.1 alpha-amylase family glycosyl hydrolase [Mammaliicoccus sciuri]HCW34453.1 glucohydrolase [Staphylococcus sp.]
MKDRKWWQKEIIYQIYPRSFYDANGDGIGDIKGITSKLEYLKDLGITMIWICPIYKSPMVDNGYDISDYLGINPEFGSMEDLDELLERAQALGIKVMLDLVINHTSDEHRWFKEALKNPNSPYRDYYIFKDGVENKEPNNWRSIFGGSVWEKLQNEDKYYMHVFDKKQPDLNFENPRLRNEIYNMINTWLDKGLAGFRVDSITFLKKDQQFESYQPDGSDGLVTCKHGTRNQPGIDIFLNELKEKTFNKYDCVTVGEAPGVKYDELSDFIGENGYFSMIFDFKYADIDVESGSDWFKRTNWTTQEFKELLFNSQKEIQKVGWSANFIENHDQPRALSKYITDEKYQNYIGGSALAMMYFFLRGTPFIYQGQELGMTNFNRKSIEEFNDISSIDNYYRSIEEGFSETEALNFVNLRSRDNTRTPFPWDNTENAGFTNGTPWIGLTTNFPSVNAKDEVENNQSLFNFYKYMIELRNHSKYKEVLTYGTFEEVNHVSESIISYYRHNETHTIQVIINLSNKEDQIEIENDYFEVLMQNYEKVDRKDQKLLLKPYEAMMIEL